MELTACDWQSVAVALTMKGEETEADAAGLVTVRLLAAGVGVGDGFEPVAVFTGAVVLAQPATASRETKQAKALKRIQSGPVPIGHGSTVAHGTPGTRGFPRCPKVSPLPRSDSSVTMGSVCLEAFSSALPLLCYAAPYGCTARPRLPIRPLLP
jgi:hypothetical protein